MRCAHSQGSASQAYPKASVDEGKVHVGFCFGHALGGSKGSIGIVVREAGEGRMEGLRVTGSAVRISDSGQSVRSLVQDAAVLPASRVLP